MAGLSVVDLRRKLELLIELGALSSFKDLEGAFDRSLKTIYGWITDERGRRADSMPSAAFEKLLDLYAPLVPDLTRPTLRDLLLGPASHLSSAIRREAGGSLMRLIEKDAIRQGKLHIRSEGLGLAEVDREFDHEARPVPIGARFRIEYPSRHDCPYVLAVQNAGASWGLFSPTRHGGIVHVPGANKLGTINYMVERTQRGHHLFVCFQAALPFPERLNGYIEDAIALDKQGLELLCASYLAQPHEHRICQALHVLIEG